ncbi:GntR family transcriptional regulator [Prosthecomicrobium hirschii]|nr:GntR family transcriptional regulator [Prosthecomicrobium hirschii]
MTRSPDMPKAVIEAAAAAMPAAAAAAAEPRPDRAAPVAAALDLQPLPRRIASQLRDLIIHDMIKPGERIVEQTLSDELGVSRTPLREALKILALEGLVRVFPNKRTLVADPSPTEIKNMLRVYATLEGLAGEMACENRDDADVLALRGYQERMIAARAEGDRIGYFRENQAFHLRIARATRNDTLIELHKTLNLRLHRIRFLGIMRQSDWSSVSAQHAAIIDALEARDGQLLKRLLIDHLDAAWVRAEQSAQAARFRSRSDAEDA